MYLYYVNELFNEVPQLNENGIFDYWFRSNYCKARIFLQFHVRQFFF